MPVTDPSDYYICDRSKYSRADRHRILFVETASIAYPEPVCTRAIDGSDEPAESRSKPGRSVPRQENFLLDDRRAGRRREAPRFLQPGLRDEAHMRRTRAPRAHPPWTDAPVAARFPAPASPWAALDRHVALRCRGGMAGCGQILRRGPVSARRHDQGFSSRRKKTGLVREAGLSALRRRSLEQPRRVATRNRGILDHNTTAEH